MLYRNRETGAIIDVVSELSGVWEPAETPKPRKSTKVKSEGSSPKKDDEK